MNLFMIMLLSFLFALLAFCIFGLIVSLTEEYKLLIAGVITSLVVFVGGIFIGIDVNTTNENIYIEQYKAQKETIEQSLSSDALSGLERIELVNKSVDINGEVAARKAKSKLWYYVYNDKHIYDDVELIDLD